MYYYQTCSYCVKVFYVYHDNREEASRILFEGIKKHLIEWGEDHKEYMFDEDPEIEINQMYEAMIETNEEPGNGYEIRE